VGLASEQPIHFGVDKAKLFPFSENVFIERSEGDLGRLGLIDFHFPCFKPVLNC
jgi:hypothetical protein